MQERASFVNTEGVPVSLVRGTSSRLKLGNVFTKAQATGSLPKMLRGFGVRPHECKRSVVREGQCERKGTRSPIPIPPGSPSSASRGLQEMSNTHSLGRPLIILPRYKEERLLYEIRGGNS